MRLHSLDAIRGVAILGILIMNIPYHVNILVGYAHFAHPLLTDQIVSFLQLIFADGRFRTLFSILFGAGLAIQYGHCEKNKYNPSLFIKTRLNWLLLFGALHALFIFGGDILMYYAICGMIARKYLMNDNAALMTKARNFLIIGGAVIVVMFAAMLVFSSPDDLMIRGSDNYQEQLSVWRSGYIIQMLAQGGVALAFLVFACIVMIWQTLGLMLLGVYLFRSGFFVNGFSPQLFRKILIAGIVSTLIPMQPLILQSIYMEEFAVMLSSISAIFVALVYAHLLVKCQQRENWLYSTLRNCGRMAFSLYLLQSICMAILFRAIMPHINPAFEETMTRTDLLVIVVVFTAIQMLLANVVMNTFGQGPFEKLWRYCYLRNFYKKSKEVALSATPEPPKA